MIHILKGETLTASQMGHIVRIALNAPDEQWGDNILMIWSGNDVIYEGPRHSLTSGGYVYPPDIRPPIQPGMQIHMNWGKNHESLKGCELEAEIFYGKVPIQRVEIVGRYPF